MDTIVEFNTDLPLLETTGNSQLSRPKASITTLEVTHFRDDGQNALEVNIKLSRFFMTARFILKSTRKLRHD